ncbi:MAG: vitamin B12 dependent-methionine synthase activation domain-containing protein [Bacillota bacterium]|jgi:hypothetical protein
MISVSADQIILNERELKARLQGTPLAEIEGLVRECKKAVYEAMDCKYCYLETAVQKSSQGCNLGFGEIDSQNLKKNLAGCEQAYIFAATLGHGVDRLLRSAGLISPLKQFITDAVASAAIEALCDKAQEDLPKPTKPRFSAGYGDFSLNCQKQLLDFIQANKRIGITLTESCLMTPTKSVTAIMGIKK